MNSGGSSFWTSGALPVIEPEFLRSIVAAASDFALVVSSDGKILSVLLNQNDDSYGKLDHWEGRAIAEFLTQESIEKFDAAHMAFLGGADVRKQIELNHTDNAAWEFPIRYTFHRIGADNAALMLGRDLRPIAETQQQLVQAQIALEKGYEARREFDARYRVLLANIREAVIFVSARDGRVKDLNEAAAALLGMSKDVLIGMPVAHAISDMTANELTEALVNASMAEHDGLVAVQTRNARRALRFVPSMFRAAGERVMICRIEADHAETSVDDHLTTRLQGLYRDGSDGILFADEKGTILSANESVLELLGVAHPTDIKGRSFSDFLNRGQIDLSMMTDKSRAGSPIGVYGTKMVVEYGAKVSVEISTVYLADDNYPAYAFVIRDVSGIAAVRQPGAAAPDEASRNVMELVGSATLKEIVAETTDVVEKMCIETAVDLTRNNRVAAAEMLGLSRQSLYVKLRKYGLLNKDKSG